MRLRSTYLDRAAALLGYARRRVSTADPLAKVKKRAKPMKVSCPPHTFTAWIRRREDFVDLRFEFYNLELDTSGPGAPRLVRANKSIRRSRIVVVFPPQHTIERAFMEVAPIKDDPSITPEQLSPAGAV